MSRPQILPKDIKQECLSLVRGYRRRVTEYHRARQDIIDGAPGRYETVKDARTGKYIRVYLPHTQAASRTTEGKAERLAEIEEHPETKCMRAVEQARLQIGLDLHDDDRRKLAEAIVLNCEDGRKFRYEYLIVPDEIGRTNFYERRMTFLADIAKYLKKI